MADNISVNTGTTATIWTDQSGTRHAQVVKLSIGADNTHSLLAFGGTAMNASLPVVLATNQVLSATGVVVASIATGTMDVVNVLSAANVTIASITTGTMNVVNVLSATNVTIASLTTGTMHVINVLSATGVLLAATTAKVGAVVATAHSSAWSSFTVVTTSGAAVAIIETSGEHTIYVTDLMVSVDVPMTVTLFSSTSPNRVAGAYLATKGGFVIPLVTPLILTSNDSLVALNSLSGSASYLAAGYTVT